MKPIARIEDWIWVDATNGTRYLVGRILDHPNQSRFMTDQQVTSPIVRMPGLGVVETENTLYCLGRAKKEAP